MQAYCWAYIRPLAASHRLHNNNPANLPTYCCGVGQLILLHPELVKENFVRVTDEITAFLKNMKEKHGLLIKDRGRTAFQRSITTGQTKATAPTD